MTKAPEKGIACTRWAVKARPPITPVQPFAGMMVFLFLSSRVMDASDVRRWILGLRFFLQSGNGYSANGIEATADKIGLGVAGVAGAAAIAHATVSAIKHARNKNNTSSENAPEEKK
ncbi:hydrogenase-1 small subunit [Salmonella enterica subsp. enterica serovar Sanjuan]|uniref:Hydrogenase-1 small subunit n=1 Tax=Salmonella enterica subsp. enterica serovar Sanjuan TaxID=1160765 RepID=A0A3S4FA39_SALET|nr:hydrogenase-1 small subunit [Salmonella enterica subsp. enterica serovar Sanjuan]